MCLSHSVFFCAHKPVYMLSHRLFGYDTVSKSVAKIKKIYTKNWKAFLCLSMSL